MRPLQPFPRYGSKYRWLDFIVDHLPETERYVEPFGGAATVLLNREPAPIEVMNDIDGDVMNFFEVLRDQRDELIDALERTPYHESEHQQSKTEPDGYLDPVERARRFFIASTMSYNSNSNPTMGGFAYSTSESRRGMAQHVSRYRYKVERLETVADRLQRVQFFSREAVPIIERFDGADTLLYLDPPYPHESRGRKEYRFEMGDEDHRELAEAVQEAEAHVAISSYRNELYDELLAGWNVVESGSKKTSSKSADQERTEALYLNYQVPDGGFESGNEQTGIERYTGTDNS